MSDDLSSGGRAGAPAFSWVAVLGLAGFAFILTAYAFGKGDLLDVSGGRLVLAVAVYLLLTVTIPILAAWEKQRIRGRPPFGPLLLAGFLGAAGLQAVAEDSAVFEYWMYVVAGGFMAGATVMGIRNGLERMREREDA